MYCSWDWRRGDWSGSGSGWPRAAVAGNPSLVGTGGHLRHRPGAPRHDKRGKGRGGESEYWLLLICRCCFLQGMFPLHKTNGCFAAGRLFVLRAVESGSRIPVVSVKSQEASEGRVATAASSIGAEKRRFKAHEPILSWTEL